MAQLSEVLWPQGEDTGTVCQHLIPALECIPLSDVGGFTIVSWHLRQAMDHDCRTCAHEMSCMDRPNRSFCWLLPRLAVKVEDSCNVNVIDVAATTYSSSKELTIEVVPLLERTNIAKTTMQWRAGAVVLLAFCRIPKSLVGTSDTLEGMFRLVSVVWVLVWMISQCQAFVCCTNVLARGTTVYAKDLVDVF